MVTIEFKDLDPPLVRCIVRTTTVNLAKGQFERRSQADALMSLIDAWFLGFSSEMTSVNADLRKRSCQSGFATRRH